MLLFTHPLLINKVAIWSFIFMGIPFKEHTTLIQSKSIGCSSVDDKCGPYLTAKKKSYKT